MSKKWFSFLGNRKSKRSEPEQANEAAREAAEQGDTRPARNCEGLRILTVEDAGELQEIMTSYLEKQGAAVTCAENGRAGLRRYLDAPDGFDIIILDIEMPVMNGYEAAKGIRGSGTRTANGIPIIAISGNTLVDGEAPLFDFLLKKPFEMQQLTSAILYVLSPPL